MLGARWTTFPLPPCADHFPGLAVADGRLGEMVLEAADPEWQADTADALMKTLYPNGSYRQ